MRSWRMSKMLLHSPRTTFLQFSKIIFYGATKYLLLGRDISQHVLEKRMCAAWVPQKSLGKWPLNVLHEIKVRPPKWVSSKWKMPHSVLRKIEEALASGNTYTSMICPKEIRYPNKGIFLGKNIWAGANLSGSRDAATSHDLWKQSSLQTSPHPLKNTVDHELLLASYLQSTASAADAIFSSKIRFYHHDLFPWNENFNSSSSSLTSSLTMSVRSSWFDPSWMTGH